MVSSFVSTLAVIVVASMWLGPGDPVGIDDAIDREDLGPRQVAIELGRWTALRELAEFEPDVAKPPGPWAADRNVSLERTSEGVRIRATWQLETIEAGWWTSPLIGPLPGMRVESATWRGRAVGIATTPMGEQEVALELAAKDRGALELIVFVPADQLAGGVDGDLDLWLLPAVRGELRLAKATDPEGRVPELVADGQARRQIDGRFWAGESQLQLRWVEREQPGADVEQPLALAQTAVGLTFGDGEVRGRARVSWLLRRGQLDAVSIDTAGLGGDLELAGPNVLEWTRSGDRIDIALKDAVDDRIDVELRWTQAIPSETEAQLAAPRITPQQAYRSESFLQIARDGELEILPQLAGWSAVARAELPDWASGYIQGTATASFRRDVDDPSARFDLLRFVPLSGPPVMVDVAAYEIATTDEGRSLIQIRYDVRNERASHLRLDLPAGQRMLGVRVNGETVTPTRDAGSRTSSEAWRIPLVRSLESVKGSLSFPVEVILIGESDETWAKKESRELPLPAVDAPVAVSRVRVYLPPRYANRVDVGDHHRVVDFSEGSGITYGLGVGVGSEQVAQADELYREALSGWMANDFDRAQTSLDQLAQLGASNSNIEGLQANLDLVQGRWDGKADEAAGGGQSAVVSRRIKDQARMRASQDKLVLDEKAKEAERYEASGEYEKAEQTLEEAKQIGDRLALLEQTESQEQMVYNQSLSSSSARVAEKQKRKVSRETVASKSGKKAPAEQLDSVDLGGLSSPETSELPPMDDGAQPLLEENEIAVGEPEPEPKPIVIEPEELRDVPIATSRDFTSVVSEAPGVVEDENPFAAPPPAPPPRNRGRGRRNYTYRSLTIDPPSPAAAPVQQEAKPVDPNAALAGPVATASSVSVHVPAIGEAVLYQHMLLPEGQPLSVHLEARRQRKPHP